jgi:hypothetical protein
MGTDRKNRHDRPEEPARQTGSTCLTDRKPVCYTGIAAEAPGGDADGVFEGADEILLAVVTAGAGDFVDGTVAGEQKILCGADTLQGQIFIRRIAGRLPEAAREIGGGKAGGGRDVRHLQRLSVMGIHVGHGFLNEGLSGSSGNLLGQEQPAEYGVDHTGDCDLRCVRRPGRDGQKPREACGEAAEIGCRKDVLIPVNLQNLVEQGFHHSSVKYEPVELHPFLQGAVFVRALAVKEDRVALSRAEHVAVQLQCHRSGRQSEEHVVKMMTGLHADLGKTAEMVVLRAEKMGDPSRIKQHLLRKGGGGKKVAAGCFKYTVFLNFHSIHL